MYTLTTLNKHFIKWVLGSLANVIKLFCHNYVAIGVISVKIIEKYAASGVNYALKCFVTLAIALN
jgi:hypothetical protein